MPEGGMYPGTPLGYRMGAYFTLYVSPERWTDRDRTEWRRALQDAGYEKTRGHGWLGPRLGDGTRLHLGIGNRPAAGFFRFRVDEGDWAYWTQDAARTLMDVVQLACERADALYGAGPHEHDPPFVQSVTELRGLSPITLLGYDLVNQLELRDLPGFEETPVAGGGVLLHPPLDKMQPSWGPDLEARYLEAEMDLGLRLDPTRYERLRGPAEGYLRRRFGQTEPSPQ